MIVADTSALITLASIDIFDLVLEEFDIHTSVTAVEELEDTAEYNDSHGKAADGVLQHRDQFTVHDASRPEFQSSRIDEGEGSCADLARDLNADFLITDDLRALPELQTLSDTRVAISPIVLRALVKRDVLDEEEAAAKLEAAAENRDWLESPIYTKARNLF
jgi:predicted nucleic acid-binding protein